MIADHRLVFSDDQDLAQDAGTYVSTNVLPLGESDSHPRGGMPVRDFGRGGGMPILLQVTETFAGGTSVQVQLVQADDEAISQNVTVIAQTGAIPVASLVQGYKFPLTEVPAGTRGPYIAFRYVLVGNFTAGKVRAELLLNLTDAPPFN